MQTRRRITSTGTRRSRGTDNTIIPQRHCKRMHTAHAHSFLYLISLRPLFNRDRPRIRPAPTPRARRAAPSAHADIQPLVTLFFLSFASLSSFTVEHAPIHAVKLILISLLEKRVPFNLLHASRCAAPAPARAAYASRSLLRSKFEGKLRRKKRLQLYL